MSQVFLGFNVIPFRNRADVRELPSRRKVQVLDTGVDDISKWYGGPQGSLHIISQHISNY